MRRLTEEEIEKYGEMRPPWQVFPYHPFSMGWRMGAGEDYFMAFREWWPDASQTLSIDERIAYIRRWPGRPAWAHVMIGMVWEVDAFELLNGDDRFRSEWFERSEVSGLPSLAAHEADLDAEDWEG